jgi:hypothetical protein
METNSRKLCINKMEILVKTENLKWTQKNSEGEKYN